MQLKPFKEIIAMSKEKIDEAMAAPRARRIKAQAELERAELENEIETLKSGIEELFADKDSHKSFTFKPLMEKLDKLALLERREKQYAKVLKQLFPE
jgi:hypothetical protein